MHRRARILIVAMVSAGSVLAGCGGDDSNLPDADGCIGTFGGAEVAVSECATCSAQGAAEAADGSGSTFMSIDISPPGGQIVVGAVAPMDIVFPAGNRAGALMRMPQFGQGDGTTISGVDFQTYLNGIPQESFEGDGTGVGNPSGGDGFYGQQSTMPFDEVRATINFTGGVTASVRIYEFCGQ